MVQNKDSTGREGRDSGRIRKERLERALCESPIQQDFECLFDISRGYTRSGREGAVGKKARNNTALIEHELDGREIDLADLAHAVATGLVFDLNEADLFQALTLRRYVCFGLA